MNRANIRQYRGEWVGVLIIGFFVTVMIMTKFGQQADIVIIPQDTYRTNRRSMIQTSHYQNSDPDQIRWIIEYSDDELPNLPDERSAIPQEVYAIDEYINSDFAIIELEYRLKRQSGKTLIIAVTDWATGVKPERARLQDKTTEYTLANSITKSDYSKLNVQCWECLYVTANLAKNQQTYPHIRDRQTKSRYEDRISAQVWVSYQSQPNPINGVTMVLFGDLMYDRGVLASLDSTGAIYEHFADWFPGGQTGASLENTNRHGAGIDMIAFNMETPVVKDKDICYSSRKPIQFCSHERIVPILRELGFTHASIANNHSYDGWPEAFSATVELLDEYEIAPIGYAINRFNYETGHKDYIWTGEVRGILLARHAYDFTVNRPEPENYCDILSGYQEQGYHSFVMTHRGEEYQSNPNTFQRSGAESFIRCGADGVFGGHPHIRQGNTQIEGKPVVRSLGNFLFDQYFSSETTKGTAVFIDRSTEGFQIRTGTFDACANSPTTCVEQPPIK